MFIELTDHLRCPGDHDEAYLVLLPDSVVQRSVQSGELRFGVREWFWFLLIGVWLGFIVIDGATYLLLALDYLIMQSKTIDWVKKRSRGYFTISSLS